MWCGFILESVAVLPEGRKVNPLKGYPQSLRPLTWPESIAFYLAPVLTWRLSRV